jgi:hypothetical protein
MSCRVRRERNPRRRRDRGSRGSDPNRRPHGRLPDDGDRLSGSDPVNQRRRLGAEQRTPPASVREREERRERRSRGERGPADRAEPESRDRIRVTEPIRMQVDKPPPPTLQPRTAGRLDRGGSNVVQLRGPGERLDPHPRRLHSPDALLFRSALSLAARGEREDRDRLAGRGDDARPQVDLLRVGGRRRGNGRGVCRALPLLPNLEVERLMPRPLANRARLLVESARSSTKGSRVLALDPHHRHRVIGRPRLLRPRTLL